MLHIIFWEPEIPGNTGAAIRLSACTGSMLHLVKPLGFDMDDAKLRRAGLDYHDLAHVMVHESLDDALAQVPGRVWALTGHASAMYSDVSYADGDGLLFGRESVGLSEEAMSHPHVEKRIRIHMREGVRSLNLANSASIVLYEAWRQLGFPGGVEPLADKKPQTGTRPGSDYSAGPRDARSPQGRDCGQCPLHGELERSTCSASDTILRGFERHIHTTPIRETSNGR